MKVLVLGGGVIGVSCAYFLARAEHVISGATMMVARRSRQLAMVRVATGASGRWSKWEAW